MGFPSYLSQLNRNTKIFALVDCNSFYASCEQAFDPSLRGKPLGILSNNDGIIVAKSKELRQLGIRTGAPVFQMKQDIRTNDIKLRSSNYTLYADISRRIMECLQQFSPNIEIYSIDEAFLDVSNVRCADWEKLGNKIQATVEQWTGIPVSVGIAHTKTLAKAANEICKRQSQSKGVLSLVELSDSEVEKHLGSLSVSATWGIGWSRSEDLSRLGIDTADKYRELERSFVNKHFSVMGERTWLELWGVSCIPMEDLRPKQEIVVSRMFGKKITEKNELKEAISEYVQRALVKLRKQNSQVSHMTIWISTDEYKDEPQYHKQISTTFLEPTNFDPDMLEQTNRMLDEIFVKGYRYHKAGVWLSELQPDQQQVFGRNNDWEEQQALMETMDKVNKQFGPGTLNFPSRGVRDLQPWWAKRTKLSPRYTTRWQELLVVKAK